MVLLQKGKDYKSHHLSLACCMKQLLVQTEAFWVYSDCLSLLWSSGCISLPVASCQAHKRLTCKPQTPFAT